MKAQQLKQIINNLPDSTEIVFVKLSKNKRNYKVLATTAAEIHPEMKYRDIEGTKQKFVAISLHNPVRFSLKNARFDADGKCVNHIDKMAEWVTDVYNKNFH